MIELNRRLMHKKLWVKVTPIALYKLSEHTNETALSDAIYFCHIETSCNKYEDYLSEKVLVEEYAQEEDVLAERRESNERKSIQ